MKSAEVAKRANSRYEEQLGISRHEEGKAWLRSAHLMNAQKRFLSAKVMALEALGAGRPASASTAEDSSEYRNLLTAGTAEFREAERILEREFDYPVLWSRRAADALTGHVDVVTCLGFSPDGGTIVSGGHDGTLRVWDVAQRNLTAFGTPLVPETSDHGFIRDVAFSPDGSYVVSVAEDGTTRVWDPLNSRELQPFERQKLAVYAVAIDPTGKKIATVTGYSGKILILDFATRRELKTLSGHRSLVYDLAFGPDGKTLASASRDSTVRLWNAESGEHLKTFPQRGEVIWAVAISPDNSVLATGSNRGAFLWDLFGESSVPRPLLGHAGVVNDLDFSPDGTFVATGGQDKTIRIWETATSSLQATLEGHSDEVTGVDFGPDGTVLASCSKDHSVKVWHVNPSHGCDRSGTDSGKFCSIHGTRRPTRRNRGQRTRWALRSTHGTTGPAIPATTGM